MSSPAACAASIGVVLDQRDIGLEALSAGELDHPLQQKRRRLLLAHALRPGLGNGFGDARLDRRLFKRVIVWDGIGDEEPAGADVAL